ncbi:hypothetical protein H312_01737 [Anncaliia algerae PRA339]|uniref:Uncharacterized protein n=1 Tax=Anncaliia algerae PRA339 TaxID=1288291 RepID=A0A059F1G9_9MICR|nr:hypothetical protein H312_01737 [Anncaliia algerae PRA339]
MISNIIQYLIHISIIQCVIHNRSNRNYGRRNLMDHIYSHSNCIFKCGENGSSGKKGFPLCLISGWRLFLIVILCALAIYIVIKFMTLKKFLNRKKLSEKN